MADAFEIEQQVVKQVEPPTVCCGTCLYFQWAVGDSGRRLPSKQGNCTWSNFTWPVEWPEAFMVWEWNRRVPPSRPRPARQQYKDDGTGCPCWRVADKRFK